MYTCVSSAYECAVRPCSAMTPSSSAVKSSGPSTDPWGRWEMKLAVDVKIYKVNYVRQNV